MSNDLTIHMTGVYSVCGVVPLEATAMGLVASNRDNNPAPVTTCEYRDNGD